MMNDTDALVKCKDCKHCKPLGPDLFYCTNGHIVGNYVICHSFSKVVGYERIKPMTIEELKTEAKKLGYRLVKNTPSHKCNENQ